MREIQMVDLGAQYRKLQPEIDAAIRSVLESTAFIKGPEVGLFEKELKEFMGVRHAITCANGTDALQLALMALGLKPGDEIITTNFTFIASVEVVALLGYKLVLADPDPDSFNISAEAVRKAMTPATKAIIPVHLFGQCADMEGIMNLAREHDLFVIEDAAQATGADFFFSNGSSAKAGTIGHIGTTSFFPSKNLGCYGDGGALYTNDDMLAAKLRSIANHGMKVRYHYSDIGINSRLDTIQAAILRVKLKYLASFNEAREKAASRYDEAFSAVPGIIVPRRMKWTSHIFHQYTLRITGGRRDSLKSYLEERKIPAMIYYPGPLHMQEAYRFLGYTGDSFPVTSKLCSEVLSLPMHPDLDRDQADHIIKSVLDFFEK